MAIDQKIVDLINAGIDGEVDASGKRELEDILSANPEARVFHSEMSMLCSAMDSAEQLEPPQFLKQIIMKSARPKPALRAADRSISRLFFSPAMRFAGAFAAGIILTLSFVSSDKISRNAFDDVTGLVGTMTDSETTFPKKGSINISRSDITGTVGFRKTGQLLVIDFDLVSDGPVDIVADFANRNVWFNGFAQLESRGTTIAAEPGQVTVRMEGKRRYALYLHDKGKKDVQVDLKFILAGNVVHEAQLDFGIAK